MVAGDVERFAIEQPQVVEVERFALGDYLHALAQGADLPRAQYDDVVRKLHRYLGVSEAYVRSSDLRVPYQRFQQELLRDGLGRFLATRYDLDKSRTAAKSGAGWQPEIWRGFADELGILGATLPEDVGGMGGGPVELMVITEALGQALVVEPYVDTVVVAGGLLRRARGEAATSVLERIVAGTAVVP